MSKIKVRRRRGREGNNNFFSSNTFFFIVLIQLAVSVSILVTLVWKIHSFDVRGASSATSTTANALQQDITARVEDQATSSLSLHIEPAIVTTPKASEEQHTNIFISELKKMNTKQQKYPQYKHTNKRAAYTKKRRMEVLTEKDIKLAPLPDHCLGQHKKGEIVLKGERHSGTNLIENILSKNTWQGVNPILNERTSTFGWKHGFLPPIGGKGRPLDPEEDTLVVMTRDAFIWLAKMYDEVYDPTMLFKRGTFSQYLRVNYTNICHDDEEKMNKNEICEVADNTIQIRTQKYKQWLSDNPDRDSYVGTKEAFLQSRVHIKLENIATNPNNDKDTAERQKQYIHDPLRETCVRVLGRDDFRAVPWHTNSMPHTNRMEVKSHPYKERKKALEKYTKDDLRFVLSQLDLEFEKKIGYDYNYVYKLLKQ